MNRIVILSGAVVLAFHAYAIFPNTGMVAHRGDSAEFPQNTIPAFLSAIQKGAEMVEFDEWRCKSGELVVIHDPIVDHVAKNAKGRVQDMTLSELKALDVGVRKHPKFAGTRIPTLEEALSVFPKTGILLNIHCKTGSAAPEVAEMVRKQGRCDQCILMMDGFNDLLDLQRKCPWAKTGWVAPAEWRNPQERGKGWWKPWAEEQADKVIGVAIALKVNYLQILFDCRLTRKQTDRLHAAGIRTIYFECNDPKMLEGLFDEGEDFVFTDFYSRCRPAYERMLKRGLGNMSVGVCEHVLCGEPIGDVFDRMQRCGFRHVRTDFSWSVLERERGHWDFSKSDMVVQEAGERGIEVLPILDYSVKHADPAWEHLDAWREYVGKVVERYRDSCPAVEVWNEENFKMFWKDPNPTNYFEMLRVTYKKIKSVSPTTKVVVGGFSGVPYDYIEELYRLGARDFFDVMNIHPYNHPGTPEGYLDVSLTRLRALMKKYRDENKPVWITEIGWPTHGRMLEGRRGMTGDVEFVRSDADKPNYWGNTEDRQAEMTIRALRIAARFGVERLYIYEFLDGGTNKNDPEMCFGLLRRDGTEKPVMKKLRKEMCGKMNGGQSADIGE